MAAQLRRSSAPQGPHKAAAPAARTIPSGGPHARVCVGAIAAAHGIKGEVKIKSFTEDPLSVGAYGPLSDETGARQFTLSHLRAPGGAAGDSAVIGRIDGVSDRNAAEALRGLRLYVPRTALPEAGAGEYYHHDLIGLTAVLTSGATLGTVETVLNFGAGDLLEIARSDKGPGGGTVIVPFSDAVVPVVDIAAHRLVIDPPDGLLDDDATPDPEARQS